MIVDAEYNFWADDANFGYKLTRIFVNNFYPEFGLEITEYNKRFVIFIRYD